MHALGWYRAHRFALGHLVLKCAKSCRQQVLPPRADPWYCTTSWWEILVYEVRKRSASLKSSADSEVRVTRVWARQCKTKTNTARIVRIFWASSKVDFLLVRVDYIGSICCFGWKRCLVWDLEIKKIYNSVSCW